MQCCSRWSSVIRAMPPAGLAFWKHGADLGWIDTQWAQTTLAKRHIGQIALPCNMLATAEQIATITRELPYITGLSFYPSAYAQLGEWQLPPRLKALNILSGFDTMQTAQIDALLEAVRTLRSLTELKLAFNRDFSLSALLELERLQTLTFTGGLSDAQVALLNADSFPQLTHLGIFASRPDPSAYARWRSWEPQLPRHQRPHHPHSCSLPASLASVSMRALCSCRGWTSMVCSGARRSTR